MRGNVSVDERQTSEARLVDNPFRRESHRPWYARRGPRWVVAVAVAVLLALNAFAFKKVGTRADPISVATAVERFRAIPTTQPASHPSTTAPSGTAGAAVLGTGDATTANAQEVASTAEPVAGATGEVGVERGPTPAPGVYVYDTSGFEHVDVLGGAQHDYPRTTTMTVTATDCGIDQRWTPIEQRFDEWDMCMNGAQAQLQTYITHHEFFGQTEEHRFDCTGVDIRPAGDIPGTVTTGTCEDRNGPNHATTRTTVIGSDTVLVAGVAVPAIKLHLEQYLTGDMNGSEISDLWLQPSDNLLVRWSSVIEAKGKTVLGQTHFHEEDDVNLTDVTPLQ